MSIILSKKHGVNPSLLVCPICGKDVGIALLGRLKDDKEAPRKIEGELCDDCKKEYITILEVDSSNNPKATGRQCFIKKDAINVECPKGVALMLKEEFEQLISKQN